MSNLSGRWKFGLLLAASTAFMWGVLPIALKGLMSTLDPMTTTFFPFVYRRCSYYSLPVSSKKARQ